MQIRSNQHQPQIVSCFSFLSPSSSHNVELANIADPEQNAPLCPVLMDNDLAVLHLLQSVSVLLGWTGDNEASVQISIEPRLQRALRKFFN